MKGEDFISFEAKPDPEDNHQLAEEVVVEDDMVMLSDICVPWLKGSSGLERRAPPFVRLHNEVLTFCQFISPTQTELAVRESLVQEITIIMKSMYADCKVHVFGSQMTKILTPSSDIDLAVLDVPIAEGLTLPDVMVAIAAKLREKLDVSYLEAVVNARVPIIKFDHVTSGLSVDICVNHDSGLRTGQLMKQLTRDFPPLLPLTLILKTYLAQRRLNDTYTGGIGSFLLSTMIISFLQHKQRIGQYVNIEPTWNLGLLLVEFLQFYGISFNYFTTGISIRDGGKYFSKQAWYKERSQEELNTPNINSNSKLTSLLAKGNNTIKPGTLCVENPDQPELDMGRGSYMIAKIRRAFEHAYQLLTVALLDAKQESYLGYIVRGDAPDLTSRAPPARTHHHHRHQHNTAAGSSNSDATPSKKRTIHET